MNKQKSFKEFMDSPAEDSDPYWKLFDVKIR